MEIPRRQLTHESSQLLNKTMEAVLKEMLRESCPCHYPRFRELSGFLHDNYQAGPVFCADTNFLIFCSIKKDANFLTEIQRIGAGSLGDFDDSIFSCRKCSTRYRQVSRQYSINFEFSYFILEDKRFQNDLGEKPIKPFPLLQGLFGFDDKEILKCAKDFKLSNQQELYNYMTQKN
ncbi:MAG: hypothetical protein LCH37_12860 [Bacteroidetes bacterium]|nr:hypothetical protein [Bacteroidota bacterium]